MTGTVKDTGLVKDTGPVKTAGLGGLRQTTKAAIKRVLGELPFTAEMYWQVRQHGKPLSKSFSMRRTEKWLPEWLSQAQAAVRTNSTVAEIADLGYRRRILFFTTLRYWTEHAVLMGLAMAGQGHDVTLAFIPYANWQKPFNRFDLRRQNAYATHVLRKAAPLLKSVSLLDLKTDVDLPLTLAERVREVSIRDVQYTLQVEEVDFNSDLFRLRQERNTWAARTFLGWMQGLSPSERPQVIVTPNGSILEMGAVYLVARYLDIPVVTYEFGEQRERIWLAHNGEVMRQDTDGLWEARQDQPLDENQWEQVRALFASRQNASLWENFSRRWQGLPSQGGEQVRQSLGLDGRPVVLLAANVIGDSLTLGRQVFTHGMTEWLERTLLSFAQQRGVQLVLRIHPGERYTTGPSVADLAERVLPDLPENIHLVAASDPINTYDLVEIADLGLVYTTTVGMEMAMSGVPVVVVGQTHYRGKGFTLDPASWQAYDRLIAQLLQKALTDPASIRLTRPQVERAWNYAYRFFFEFPLPYPWHLLHFWNEFEQWPMAHALSPEGQAQFGRAFRALAGEPITWSVDSPADISIDSPVDSPAVPFTAIDLPLDINEA